MPDLAFERLEYVVLDGQEVDIEFAVLSAQFGDGHGARALVGSPAGLRTWRIKYDHLARQPHRRTGRFSVESAASYLWGFWCDRMAEGNSSFVRSFVDPRDNKRKDWLVGFTETKLTYTEFRQRFYTTGIEVRQRRERGVNFLDDGSLGEHTNPDEI
jgi:hypothetical protein